MQKHPETSLKILLNSQWGVEAREGKTPFLSRREGLCRSSAHLQNNSRVLSQSPVLLHCPAFPLARRISLAPSSADSLFSTECLVMSGDCKCPRPHRPKRPGIFRLNKVGSEKDLLLEVNHLLVLKHRKARSRQNGAQILQRDRAKQATAQ